MMENNVLNNGRDLEDLLRTAASRPFTPLAYYSKHMDCIRVELRDCSTFERRIDEYVTVLYDNYPQSSQQEEVVGIMIKGVKHFFQENGLPLEGIVLVTEILDCLVKALSLPEEAETNIRRVETVASTLELSVDMSSDTLALAA